MLGFSFLLSFLSRGLNSHSQRRADDAQLRQELLAHQRRQLLHASIPEVYAVQEQFGARFEELRYLLIQHDPAFLGPVAAASPLYAELTRTLLYQLDKATTQLLVVELVQREIGLWFGRHYAAQSGVGALATAIDDWRQQ
ncbi:hypothetical protein LGH70_06185 [Hymenobacter sp. BT635]|uniref:Uncharacterized protein n=1 Tax=Hymenobacter nitidus TaxID=2880929 RepID=A0ABS8A9U4_9BACT|nr:hypothetical protein [Hymenobacter nitidus]MCB2377162.1 hypothetical protein [Hymenobacter nitidus]